MKKLMMIIALLLISGCTVIRPGESRIIESRVIGMDLSVPVPGTQGMSNIINLKFGWSEIKYAHVGDRVQFKSNSTHKDINLITGKGSVYRQFEINSIKK